MPRTKGAKNKHYKEISERGTCVTFRFKDYIFEWLKQQPNRSSYVKSLIEKDMIEKGIPTKKED
jgi:hypothetical protein